MTATMKTCAACECGDCLAHPTSVRKKVPIQGSIPVLKSKPKSSDGPPPPDTLYQASHKASSQGMTNQAAFDAWFAGSKVVDKDGNPLRCYHGTKSSIDFDEFSVDGPVIDEDDPDGNAYSSGSGADVTAFLGAHFAEGEPVSNRKSSTA